MSERKINPGEEHPAGLQGVEHAHSSDLPTTGISQFLDKINLQLGSAMSWLWLAVMAVIMVSVISRYFFGIGSVALEEAAWHISSFAWLVGIAYTIVHDQHVRVDVIHELLSPKTKAWIELLGLVLLLLPFLAIVLYYSVPYAYQSWLISESSSAPSGLPYRWVLKTMIGMAMLLSIVAAIARLLRCTSLLFAWPKPRPASKPS